MRNSRLWSTTLAPQEDDTHRDARDRLRATLLRSREHAHSLVSEVARDLPTYTVHDISHLDALWEMADLLLGREQDLNPAEAFVFGQAVLFHDAAMSLAVARFDRDIAGDPLWRDLVTRGNVAEPPEMHPTCAGRKRSSTQLQSSYGSATPSSLGSSRTPRGVRR